MDVNSILIFSAFPLIRCFIESGGLIKMAYCAERDEEFHVSTMFEYYKALFHRTICCNILVIDEYRNRWHTKLHKYHWMWSFHTIGLFTIMMIPLLFWKFKSPSCQSKHFNCF
jgi:hypothetical protein